MDYDTEYLKELMRQHYINIKSGKPLDTELQQRISNEIDRVVPISSLNLD